MAQFSKEEWGNYLEATKDRPATPLLTEALIYTNQRGAALDIGAGALRDTRHLLAEGFESVTALDIDPRISDYANGLDFSRLHFAITPLEEFAFPKGAYNIVNAQSALFFVPEVQLKHVMDAIKDSLGSGGIFTGNLVGERDGWKEQGINVTYLARQQAESFLAGLRIHKFEESDTMAPMATGGEKRWHLFNFIAEKP